MISNLLLLIKHDIFEGILKKWKFFIIAVLFFMFVSAVFVIKTNYYFNYNDIEVKRGVLDFLFNIFIGNEPFEPEEKKGIKISIIWFVFHALIFSLIGFYLNDDLKRSSTTLLLRVKSRKLWWTSKFIWSILSTVFYFSLCLIVLMVFGKLSLSANNMLALDFFNINLNSVKEDMLFIVSFILPLIVSMAMSAFNAMLSLVIKPLYSYIIVLSIIAVSAFYKSPFLIFNFSMISRNEIFSGGNGITILNGVLFSLFLMIVSYLLGLHIIKKRNII